MSATDYSKMPVDELRDRVADIAKAAGRSTTDIQQRKNGWCKQRYIDVLMYGLPDNPTGDLFASLGVPAEAPAAVEAVKEPLPLVTPEAEPSKGEVAAPPPAEPAKEPLQVETAYEAHYQITGKGRHPDVVRKEREAAKEPLRVKGRGKQRGVLANGRDAKGSGKFENWCGQVYPADVAYPAWRAMTKAATDVANICRAKMGYEKHKLKKKDPIFHFTVAEAERTYKITRPTFTKAIKLLLDVGFIEHARRGGMPDGVGVKALYRMVDGWKTWEPPARDNSNIFKARAARNILPAKGP